MKLTMQKYFNVYLEFNHQALREEIEKYIKNGQKGYVCVVDANVLTIAQKNEEFRNVLNNALVNTCDGSSIAMLAGMIYKKKFRALNGPELFTHYIEKDYHQLLLGSNEETSNLIKEKLAARGLDNSHLSVLPLPFKPVEEFDYSQIAAAINKLQPDIIWVSLGAPKQEFFMSRLLPFLDKGVMFGIGAAFNFYLGNINMPEAKIGALKFIWISRIISEPGKQLSRVLPYLRLLPGLYWKEKKKSRHNQSTRN